MSKSDLKAAMQSLKVNKPLKLMGRAPTFAAPAPTVAPTTLVESDTLVAKTIEVESITTVPNVTQVENNALVTNQTEVNNLTQVDFNTEVVKKTLVENYTEVEINTQVPNATLAENQTIVHQATKALNTTVVEKTTQVTNHTSALNETQVSKPTEVVNAIKRATEQDSSVVFEARASEGLEKGYTRLPNTVLMKMANGDLTRGEMKILLLIARFTISFQRKLAPLSKAVLERQSGLRGPGVLEALSGLVSKQLIIKEQGDQHKPNMLGLVLPADWDQLTQKSETQVAKATTVENHTQVIKPTPAEVVKTTTAQVQNPTPFKDIIKYSNKLSLSEMPENLKNYFSELKPAKKRESEMKAFEELCLDYKTQDIGDAFALLKKRGIGSEGEPCHSPMAFLSKAINGFMDEVNESRRKAAERAGREEKLLDEKRRLEAAKAKEAEEWEMKERSFLQAFPEEKTRTEILNEFCKGLPFKLSGDSLWLMGVGKWWEQKANNR
jgi:hypothetical protein